MYLRYKKDGEMIVVVGGIKGGSGKTTIATNLTVMRAFEGKKVLLVDADEQKSASSWSHQRDVQGINTPWTTIQLAGAAVRSQIQKMMGDYDDIIIDVGGRDTTSQRSALTIADSFIIPFQPRSLDIWTLGSVKALISEIVCVNVHLKSYALINRGDSIGGDNQDAIEILKDCPHLLCLPFIVGQRKAFANAATDGLGVTEMKNLDKKAIAEIQSLYRYIYYNSIE
jgi:chromosome partitioning protein